MFKLLTIILAGIILIAMFPGTCFSQDYLQGVTYTTPQPGMGGPNASMNRIPGMKVRIKDLTHIRGVCENQLIGFGIVTGLNGTGDRKGVCINSLTYALKNLGINNIPTSDFNPKNMAAVMVTANMPAFAKSGDNIDVIVSSLGDATSIEGGVLLLTPLRAANGVTYGTAQGPVNIGGLTMTAGKLGDKGNKNWQTTGRVVNGGLLCKDMNTELTKDKILYLLLNDPDYNTASMIAKAINDKYSALTASAIDSQTVKINNIYNTSSEAVDFLNMINNIEIVPEMVARVVINERTGTVVIGNDVRIMPVAISHGGIDITIGTATKDQDPKTLPKGKVFYLSTGASVKTLVEMLNYVGASPRDIISIMQALKRASVLPAELITL